MLFGRNNVGSTNNSSFIGASVDHTTLYKSCVKTIRARSKTVGTSLPQTRIFPSSADGSCSNGKDENKNKMLFSTTQYFQRARQIQDNISTHKQLLHNHRRRYMGQMNDPTSMSLEDCASMDKRIVNNLKTIEQQLVELEKKVPGKALQSLRNAVNSSSKLNEVTAVAPASGNGNTKDYDVACCMAITAVIVRASLQDLSSVFVQMKEDKARKQTIKAKLLRFQRPASVEKSSVLRERQKRSEQAAAAGASCAEELLVKNTRKKVQFEDWRADEHINVEAKTQNQSLSTNSELRRTSSSITSSDDHDDQTADGCEKFSDRSRSPSVDRAVEKSKEANAKQNENARATTTIATDYNESNNDLSLNDEDCEMLEQENAQMYNELQSTHEEVRQITRQVAELGRLQTVLLESVEEQAVVADSVHDTVLHATDNVQEGNEQIREAMRKDASFRVWIMIFLIVMSFTILFLDWYND